MRGPTDWNAGESLVKYARSCCGHCKSRAAEGGATHQYRHCLQLEGCCQTGGCMINWTKRIPERDFRGKIMVSREDRKIVCF